MDQVGFVDAATASELLGVATDAIRQVLHGAWWKLTGDEQLDLARQLEVFARTTAAVQIHAAGEIDLAGTAAKHSATSTGALLSQLLTITVGEARSRVHLARQICDTLQPTGDLTGPTLPVLGAALEAGLIGTDHARTITTTMRDLPTGIAPDVRDRAETHLVEQAQQFEPRHFATLAAHLITTLDPDGTLDDRDPASKAELHIGTRNPATGLTPISGRLDDLGIATVRTALDGLAAPCPAATDGTRDTRPAATRHAHALIAALRHALDAGTLPTQGGQRPHLTVTITLADLENLTAKALLDDGTLLSPAATRALLCDANILPAVLGGHGEVLDIGRASRTFPQAIRRAITLRDRGCIWPGCDRPADLGRLPPRHPLVPRRTHLPHQRRPPLPPSSPRNPPHRMGNPLRPRRPPRTHPTPPPRPHPTTQRNTLHRTNLLIRVVPR